MITIVFSLLDWLLSVYGAVVFIAVILSLLISFNVLDTRNRLVWQIHDFFYRITDPVLRPIRSVLPAMSGFDFSPLVLLVIIYILRQMLTHIYFFIAAPSVHSLLF